MKRVCRCFLLIGTLFVMLPAAFSDEVLTVGDASAGKLTFDHLCLYCHSNDEDSTIGPSLEGIGERRSVAWLNAWLKNPDNMIKKDMDAKDVRDNSRYNMAMPTLPIMQDDVKRADVIAYLLTSF